MIILNVKTTYVPIHKGITKDIICPICNTKDSIEITIYQKHIDTGLVYNTTNKLSGTAYCTNCKTEIPNVQWTPEIETVFEKLKAESQIETPGKKYGIIFKILLAFLALVAFGIGYALFSAKATADDKRAILENPTINNKLLIQHQVRESLSQFNDLGNSWAIIRNVTGDTIIIQMHTEKVPLDQINGAKPPTSGYDGKLYKIKKDEFRTKERVSEYHQEKGMGLNYAYIWSFQKE